MYGFSTQRYKLFSSSDRFGNTGIELGNKKANFWPGLHAALSFQLLFSILKTFLPSSFPLTISIFVET